MPLDPVLQNLLKMIPAVPPGPLNYPELRQQSEAMIPMIVGPQGVAQVGSVEERTVAGLHGEVPLRIYRPEGAASGTMHFIHGGGWCLGTLASVDPVARTLCRDLSMVIVTSTYRLAPEHPFPAPYEDAMAAASWVRSSAAELGGIDRPVLIAGDSAGGNLAAAVCIGIRDQDDVAMGLGAPGIAGKSNFDLQLLLYPAVDLRTTAWDLPSRKADADPTLTADSLRKAAEAYTQGKDPGNWRVSPLAATTLAGLPAALVVVLQVDPLRDEAVQYANRLKADKVPTEVMEFDHLTHGFAHLSGIIPAGGEALAQVLAKLQEMLAAQGRAS